MLFTDELRSISGADEAIECDRRCSSLQSKERLPLLRVSSLLFDRVMGLCSLYNDHDLLWLSLLAGALGVLPAGGKCSLKGMSFPPKMMSFAGQISKLKSLENSKSSGDSGRERGLLLHKSVDALLLS